MTHEDAQRLLRVVRQQYPHRATGVVCLDPATGWWVVYIGAEIPRLPAPAPAAVPTVKEPWAQPR